MKNSVRQLQKEQFQKHNLDRIKQIFNITSAEIFASEISIQYFHKKCKAFS